MQMKKSDRKKERQEQAAIRQAEYDSLSPRHRYERAKARRGNSRKEVTRLILEDFDE